MHRRRLGRVLLDFGDLFSTNHLVEEAIVFCESLVECLIVGDICDVHRADE